MERTTHESSREGLGGEAEDMHGGLTEETRDASKYLCCNVFEGVRS